MTAFADMRPVRAGWGAPAAAAAVLGCGLLAAFSLGSKWLGLVSLAYLGLAGLALARDRRLLAVGIFSASISLGLQYNVWTHGNRFTFQEHAGGAPPEPVIYLVDLPILMLAALWLCDLRSGRVRLPAWTRTETLAAAFLGASLLSAYNTDEHLLVAFEALRYLKYFLVYLMLRAYFDRPAVLWAALAAQIAVLSIQGMVSVMQYFLGFVLPFPVGGMAGGSMAVEMIGTVVIQRVSGLLGHCNTFSVYLSAACSFCLVVLCARIKPWMRAAVLPFLFLGVLSLVLTFSRNGWMVFAVNAAGIALWARYTRRLKAWMAGAMALLCVVLVAGLAATGVLHVMFTRVFDTDGREFESRGDLALVAREMIGAHPVLGVGLNTFEESMIRYDPNHISHILSEPVHNGFLLVAAETGLPALLLLLALLWRHLSLSARLLRQDDELPFVVGLSGLAVFAGAALANLYDVTLRKEPILGLIVLTAAMVAAAGSLGEGSGAGPSTGLATRGAADPRAGGVPVSAAAMGRVSAADVGRVSDLKPR